MKTVIIILLQVACLPLLLGQSYVDKKGDTHLWGSVELDQLLEGEFGDWYHKNQEDYTSDLTEKDGSLLKGVKVKVFIGTWCGDTKYLLPKFAKAWEAMGLKTSDLEIIAVHHEGNLYKQGPKKETYEYNIHRVPTFVFEKEGDEIGRIVERTVFDLDTDIRSISKGNPYKERYQAVSMLNEKMMQIEPDSILSNTALNECYRLVRREVSGPGELNTYGYVLLAQGKNLLAELVLRLNRYLFPYYPNARDSYGEILYENGKAEEAKEQYLEALRLNPEDENVIAQLAKINEELKSTKE